MQMTITNRDFEFPIFANSNQQVIKVKITNIIRNPNSSNNIIKNAYKVVISIRVLVLTSIVVVFFFHLLKALCRNQTISR
jgi:hypothetical protein